MISPKFFGLKGFAYLENISYRESKCIVQLGVLQQLTQDIISLECEVSGVLEEYMYNLFQEVKKECSVIIKFSAAYQKFGVAFHTFGPEGEDSDVRLVTLCCKLLSVGNYYINGVPFDKNDFKHLLAA